MVLGVDVADGADALKPRIGVSLQTAAMYPKLTVVEVIDLFRSFYQRSRPTDELIDLLELGERRNARTKDLSGGQRQRLGGRPGPGQRPGARLPRRADDGLDPAARRSLWDLVRRLKAAGRSVLLTTHYMEEAEILCDRLAIMDHGHILEMGTVDELISQALQGARGPVRRDRRPRRRRARRRWPRSRRSSTTTTRSCSTRSDVAATIGGAARPDRGARRRAAEPRHPAGDARGRLPRPDRPGAARLTGTRPMHALLALTLANIRSYTRDRAAVFWTLAFPLIFIVLFGLIFQGSGSARLDARLGRRGRLARPRPSCAPAFAALDGVDAGRRPTPPRPRSAQMQDGKVDAVIVVPAGYGAALAASQAGGGPPTQIEIYTDPSRPAARRAPSTRRSATVLGDRQPRRPAAARRRRARRRSRPRTSTPSATSSRACSGCRSCRSGIFAAIPLVGRPREAHPQAARRDAAPALAAGRLERAHAAAHRARPGGHHRRRRHRCCSASRSPAA